MTPFSSAEAPFGSFLERFFEYHAAFPSPQAYGYNAFTVKAARKRPLWRRERYDSINDQEKC